jgi:hypothetical protein
MKTSSIRRLCSSAIVSIVALFGFAYVAGVAPFTSGVAGAVETTSLSALTSAPDPASAGSIPVFSTTLSGGGTGLTEPTGSPGALAMSAYTDSNCNTFAFALNSDETVDSIGNGTYTFTPATPLAPGNYYGSAFYDGDTNNSSSSTGSCTLIATVNVYTTSLSPLTATPNPAAAGSDPVFSTTLSGGGTGATAPTGSPGALAMSAYTDSNCNTFAFALNSDQSVDSTGNGTYTFTPTTPLAAGTYYGSAFYEGDANNSSSSTGSCTQILVVNSVTTTTLTLTATPNPSRYGQSVTFDATLSGGLTGADEPMGSISIGAYTSSNCSDPTPAFTLGLTGNVDAGNGTYDVGSTVPPGAGQYYGEAYFADTDGFNSNASSGDCVPILFVQRAHLVITAPSFTLPYGSTIPTLTPTYSGLKNGDLAPSTPPTCTTNATSHSSPGNYKVTCSGASDPNYFITYVPGTIKIVAAPTSFKVTEFLTTTKSGTTAVLGETGLPANAVGFVFFQGPSNGCTIYLTGKPGEATTCFANFGTNVPYAIYGIFLDTGADYTSSYSTNTLSPHG